MVKRSRLKRGSKVWKKKLKIWKPEVWLRKSKAEFDAYRKTKDLKKLAQSGEKLWNAFGLYLDGKFKKEFVGIGSMKRAVEGTGDEELINRFRDSYHLHTFFYRGYTDDISIEEGEFKRAYNYLKKRVG